jgi:GGDEF domain-containing protein
MFIDCCDIHLSASAGRVVYSRDGGSRDELIRAADEGLYRANSVRGAVSIKTLPGKLTTC